MATDTQFEELITGLSKEELAALDYICKSLDFASTLGKDSYVLNILNTSCSSLDNLVTHSKIVFDNTNQKIVIETAGKVTETVIYEGGMLGVKRVALSLLGLGIAEGDPFSIGMGVVTSSGTYIMGSVGLNYISKNAGAEVKDIVSKIYEINSQEKINQNIPTNNSNTKSVVSLDTATNEKTVYSVDTNNNNNLTPEYKTNIVTGSTVLLKAGETISHVAVGTNFSTKELLQYNNLTENDARSLPVGYEIQIPKNVKNIDGGYGNIKMYETHSGGLIYFVPMDEQGNIGIIVID